MFKKQHKIKNRKQTLDSSLELRTISSFTTFMVGAKLDWSGEHKHNIRFSNGEIKERAAGLSGNDCTSSSLTTVLFQRGMFIKPAV